MHRAGHAWALEFFSLLTANRSVRGSELADEHLREP